MSITFACQILRKFDLFQPVCIWTPYDASVYANIRNSLLVQPPSVISSEAVLLIIGLVGLIFADRQNLLSQVSLALIKKFTMHRMSERTLTA